MQTVLDENNISHSFPDDATSDEMNTAIGSMPLPNGMTPGGSFWGNSWAGIKNDADSILNSPAEVGKAETQGVGNAIDFIKDGLFMGDDFTPSPRQIC